MRIHYSAVHSVASWKWILLSQPEAADDEEVCGICRVAFEGCCPECSVPGDDCPLIFGKCTHVFHMHCLIRWLNTEQSKGCCPMDRQNWVTADGQAADPNSTNNINNINNNNNSTVSAAQ